MDGKIRILFYNLDGAGVNYFRTQTPAQELEKNHNDEFYVEINPQIDFNDPKFFDYLKTFHIIHYHRQFLSETSQMLKLAEELRKSGTILIVDIDDYWKLHRLHPFYNMSKEKQMHVPIIENLKIADYVTTTTDLFASEIRNITGKDNVEVFYNSIDPKWMKQFQNNWKPDPDGLIRITYMAGSSHMVDVQQLEGVVNVLQTNPQTRGKFKIIIAGWDTEGNTTDITFNQDFSAELQKKGLWTHEVVKAINKSRGNVDQIPKISQELKDKYRDKVFNSQQRDIKSEESVYLIYEKLLSDNHRLIKNPDYMQWLMNFERKIKYEPEDNFGRRWTQKANTYAQVLDETDIVLAPLADNEFNNMKCVVGDTLISTNKGIFKIKDLVNKKHNLQIFNEKIINHFKYKNEKVIKFITDYGFEFEGTETHKIRVGEEWKSMKDFNVGDDIKITPYEFENNEYQTISYPLLLSKRVTDKIKDNSKEHMLPHITINESYGRFFGYMLGDGSFSKGYLRISCDKRHTKVVEDVVGLVKGMGLSPILIEKKPDKRCFESKVKEGYGLDIHIPSKHLSEICIQENLRNKNGKVFEIPHFILKSPKSVISEFLKGLFEADGTVSEKGSCMSLTTKNHLLAKQIQFLLLGFGILSKVAKSFNKTYKRHYYVVRLNREATDKYYNEIGFVSTNKKCALENITKKFHSNRFKDEDYNIKIVEIEYDVKDVYDVEVNKIHMYNGNGIINHNSNLKQVECWTRKLPIVCSDIPPYNVHGRHMENCVLIRSEKNAHKYWKRYLKQLILDPDLRQRLGNQLYEDFKEEYNLEYVTKKRAAFYKSVVLKGLEVV